MQANGERKDWVDFVAAKQVPFETVMREVGLAGAAKLRRFGDEWKGICPLHGGTKESFGFNVAKGFFNCFGCKRSGNVLDFVNHKVFGGKDLKAAARWLLALAAEVAGVSPATGEEAEVLPDTEPVPAVADDPVLSDRDRAVVRGVARYLAAVFAPLGNVETIEQELSRFVSEEVRRE
jgi:DNA primase